MHILGISAFYHDSAAALVRDGEIIAAAQEERFTRTKHDSGFPQHAVDFCLAEGGISTADLDCVVFYDKPLLKFDRLLETYLAYAPLGFRSFCQAMPVWLHKKLFLSREIDRALHGAYRGRYVYTEHHEAHAASAFYPSPFEEAAILTVDGVGEWATASLGTGAGNHLELTHELHFPHSLGLLYSAFTYYTGFRVNSGEYKLMGLAPYGRPVFADLIHRELIDLKADGSFRMNMRYFNYCQGLTMTNNRFQRLFGQSPRQPEGKLSEFHMDVAASIQKVTEEIVLRMSRHVRKLTGKRHLCLAGGVALNCVANGLVLREGIFDDLWIQPAAGDAGGALGAALFAWYQLSGQPRTVVVPDAQKGSLLGPAYADVTIQKVLDGLGARYEYVADDDALCDRVADLIENEKVVGWFQGRMEFGPRALGARSILGDARSTRMQSVMNQKIKFRESFRPFAPAVLRHDVAEYFDLPQDQDSPYMLLVGPVREEKRTDCGKALSAVRGLEKLYVPRSSVPAVTHVDFSARVQTVDATRHGLFFKLLTRFKEKTGCSVLINTSFNVRGEPIVCSPQDAHRCFLATAMDVLVIGHFVLHKEQQQNSLSREEVSAYFGNLQLD